MKTVSKLPKRGPVETVESNGIKIPIYQAKAFGKSGFMLAYYADGKRIRERASSLDDARKAAKAKIKTLTSGAAHVGTLTPRQTAVISEAFETLQSIGIPLTTVCREYVEAFKILNGEGTLADAARSYIKTLEEHPISSLKFQDVVVEFLKRNEKLRYSESYQTDCRRHLA